MTEKIVELDLGATPSGGVSGAVLLQTERRVFLTFNAMRPTDRPSPRGGFYREDAGTAVVELIDCTITKFGYPNDEAWMRIPRTKGLSYGIYEVKNSAWPDEIAALNRHAFPGPQRRRGRHFLFLFHDSSLECIAGELSLTLRSEPYPEIMAELTAWWDHV